MRFRNKILDLAETDPEWYYQPLIQNHIQTGKDQARHFFKKLYGPRTYHPHPSGVVTLCYKEEEGMVCYPKSIGMRSEIIDVSLYLGQRGDIYFNIGLQEDLPPRGQRGKSNTVSLIPGFWMDIDEKGSHHKSQDLPCSIEEAESFLRSLEKPPSMIICTGGGLHAYWVFQELCFIETDSYRMKIKEASKTFQQRIINEGKKHGWSLDNTSDLARLLRIPGTWNWKTIPPKPVYFLEPCYADLPDRDINRI